MNVWTKVDGEYCAEISDLQGNGLMKSNVVTLPDTMTPASFADFQRKTDDEGDITHWTLTRDDTVYTIFND